MPLPLNRRPLTPDALAAYRRLQSTTESAMTALMAGSPDCAWLRHAMAEGAAPQCLGLFWLFLGDTGRWPAVLWLVTRGARRRAVRTYWAPRGGWACETQYTDAVVWSQYAGNPAERPSLLAGHDLTPAQAEPAQPPAPGPRGESHSDAA